MKQARNRPMPLDTPKTLATMRQRGVTQKAVASALEVDGATVSKQINGKMRPRAGFADRLESFLGVPKNSLRVGSASEGETPATPPALRRPVRGGK